MIKVIQKKSKHNSFNKSSHLTSHNTNFTILFIVADILVMFCKKPFYNGFINPTKFK